LQSFGAVGDGINDDTQAFISAISTMKSGVLYIPAGSYIIKQKLEIAKRIVLRGGCCKTNSIVFLITSCKTFGLKYIIMSLSNALTKLVGQWLSIVLVWSVYMCEHLQHLKNL
jgi:hypothetical protein